MSQYIWDDTRKTYMNLVNERIASGKSVMIIGEYGSGKSEFLKHITLPGKHWKKVELESLDPVHMMLASILHQTGIRTFDFEEKPPVAAHKHIYLRLLTASKEKYVIIIDEAHELKRHDVIFAYLKRLMNKDVPVIMAGRPGLDEVIKRRSKYPDVVVSRMELIHMMPLFRDSFVQAYPQFDQEAIELLYFDARSDDIVDMRKLVERSIPFCLSYIKAKGLDKVTFDIARKFTENEFDMEG